MPTNNATNTSDPVTVAQGGTGDASFTAYAVICGGTTSTAALQSVSGVGTANQVLTSNGASALPSWQTVPGGMALISTQTVTSPTGAIVFSSMPVSSYTSYWININNVTNSSSSSPAFQLQMGTGGTLLTSYYAGNNSNPYNSTTLSNSTSATSCLLSPSISTGGAPISGYISLSAPVGYVAQFNGQLFLTMATSDYINCFGCNAANSISQLQFSYTTGNVSGGSISLYNCFQ